MKKAIVLVSGGLDSTTCLAIARSEGYELFALSFDYGQRHKFELLAAEKVAKSFDVKKHLKISMNLNLIGGSALTDDIPVPKDRLPEEMESSIPVTYVPARNTIFLSYALAWAEVLDCNDIFIGVNALDYSGYPDCRPEYIKAFQDLARLATKKGVAAHDEIEIHAPLIAMTKAEIIRKGLSLGVDYGLTHTCYDPSSDGVSCGKCDACLFRLKGFEEAGTTDPIEYGVK